MDIELLKKLTEYNIENNKFILQLLNEPSNIQSSEKTENNDDDSIYKKLLIYLAHETIQRTDDLSLLDSDSIHLMKKGFRRLHTSSDKAVVFIILYLGLIGGIKLPKEEINELFGFTEEESSNYYNIIRPRHYSKEREITE